MIEIVDHRKIKSVEDVPTLVWLCWLEITQDGKAWLLPTTAPGELAKNELQAHFDAREEELWRVAQKKQYAPDILKHLPTKRLLKAVALALLDEINFVRENPGYHEALTVDEMVDAVKEKLRQ
ncbi:MAG: hypothetical protein KAJ73_01100 [Zetaproteobacteria bacterium]|nr:hypothetical protein [Zetaproteobacteria bacterium]